MTVGFLCAITVLSPFVWSQPILFREVGITSGIDFTYSQGARSSLLVEDMGSGVALIDYDNDHDLDFYLVNLPGPLQNEITSDSPGNVMYRNNGDGTFTDVTKQAGVGHQGFGIG